MILVENNNEIFIPVTEPKQSNLTLSLRNLTTKKVYTFAMTDLRPSDKSFYECAIDGDAFPFALYEYNVVNKFGTVIERGTLHNKRRYLRKKKVLKSETYTDVNILESKIELNTYQID